MQAAHVGWSLVRRTPRNGSCHSPTRVKLLISRLITRSPKRETSAENHLSLSCVPLEKSLASVAADRLSYLFADGAYKNFFLLHEVGITIGSLIPLSDGQYPNSRPTLISQVHRFHTGSVPPLMTSAMVRYCIELLVGSAT